MSHPLFHLFPRRVHEVEGSGAVVFALTQAARASGPVVWITPAHLSRRLMPWSLPAELNHRLLHLRPASDRDLLWTVEEALRSNTVSMVIAEPQKPLSLIVGRRLQLAAEAGRTTGLMLILRDAGSNAAETRWHCTAAPAGRAGLLTQHWSVVKNKKGTIADWHVVLDEQTFKPQRLPQLVNSPFSDAEQPDASQTA